MRPKDVHILQLSEKLPDIRVEKTIHSDIRLGHKVSFIGIAIKDPKDVPNVHRFPLSMRIALFRMKKFQKELKKLVFEINPDIIHAHDLILARAAFDLGYPVVYNDHEYWTKLELSNHPLRAPWTKEFIKKNITWPYRYSRYRSWEKKILSKSVVITVHENIAKEHRKKAIGSFVIPNQPEREEVKHIWEEAETCDRPFDAVYVGRDMSRKSPAYRQASQAYSILKKEEFNLIIIGDQALKSNEHVMSTSYIPHERIYTYTMQATTGLLPWKSNSYHQYVDANKYYLYVHSGGLPIIPHLVEPPNDNFSLRFKRIDEIPDLIRRAIRQHDPSEIIEHSKKCYLWEYYEDQLSQAYELALEKEI